MHPIIFLKSTPAVPQVHTPTSHTKTAPGYWVALCCWGRGPHQELLALLLFGGTKHLVVLQIILQGLQLGLQELLQEGEKGDITGAGFRKPPPVPSWSHAGGREGPVHRGGRGEPSLGRMNAACAAFTKGAGHP